MSLESTRDSFLAKSPHKSSQTAVRAKYYRTGDAYTVVVVENGKHRFYDADDQESAEALVRLVER